MNRAYFIKKAAKRQYLRSIIVLFTAAVIVLSYIIHRTNERNLHTLENNIIKRNFTLKNRLKGDIVNSLRWLSIYNEAGIFEKLLRDGEDPQGYEDIIESIAEKNYSIEAVAFFDSSGRKVNTYFERNGRRKRFTVEVDLSRVSAGEKTLFVDAFSPRHTELDLLFYFPVFIEESFIGFFGVSYSVDTFFNQFKEEINEALDTGSPGLTRRVEAEKEEYFSVDIDENEREKVLRSKNKVTTLFILRESLEKGLFKYFSHIDFSEEFLHSGILTSYNPDDYVKALFLGTIEKYLISTLIFGFVVAVLLWLYIIERVERISTFKALKTYNIKLRKTLETKDMLFSIIGHDLRSPFTSLLGYFQVLERKYDKYSKEDVRKIINTMSLSCHKLSILTENLLRWSALHNKKIQYTPEDICLAEMLRDYEEVFRVQLESKDLNLRIDVSEEYQVRADRNLLEASVRNIISNAVKFSRAGGEVNISASEEGDNLLLFIEDNGVGIPEDVKPHILRGGSISTAGTNNEKGTGLGLYIVREFTKLNRTRVSFESSSEKGTKFILEIPKA